MALSLTISIPEPLLMSMVPFDRPRVFGVFLESSGLLSDTGVLSVESSNVLIGFCHVDTIFEWVAPEEPGTGRFIVRSQREQGTITAAFPRTHHQSLADLP